ncbi:MAG: NAD(+)/NADH kinase [Lachnospiraceae bacterium]|nr:NAD(+)/NADH kinase [Lachnospiraceae bacterium]
MKKACENFLIVTNTKKDHEMKSANKLKELIEALGARASVVIGDSEEHLTHIDADKFENVDCVVVMGGDGTILRVSHAIEGTGLPMIGVNLGTVGFLTEVGPDDMERMLDRLMNGDYSIEERMMLKGRVFKKIASGADNAPCEKRQEVAVINALNDIVLAREDALQLISVKISLNGSYFDTTEADGILISTPTGSTGYNLSAGGPIVNPGTKLLVLTPISPYSLTRRSIVFGAEDKITLELMRKRKNSEPSGLASFDGYRNVPMQIGDYVEVSASDEKLQLIKLEDQSVYQVLQKKLGMR